jgi:hypothetical protein
MKWVVNSIPVGNGSYAMKYLAQYVFRVAISNNRILKHQDGFVIFKFKNSKTKLWNVIKLNTEEFIRRFLLHVLPPRLLLKFGTSACLHQKTEAF